MSGTRESRKQAKREVRATIQADITHEIERIEDEYRKHLRRELKKPKPDTESYIVFFKCHNSDPLLDFDLDNAPKAMRETMRRQRKNMEREILQELVEGEEHLESFSDDEPEIDFFFKGSGIEEVDEEGSSDG